MKKQQTFRNAKISQLSFSCSRLNNYILDGKVIIVTLYRAAYGEEKSCFVPLVGKFISIYIQAS